MVAKRARASASIAMAFRLLPPMNPRLPDPRLGDGVVALRPPDERDLTAIELGIHDPDVVRWFGEPDASAADVLAMNRRRWASGSPTFSTCGQDDICVGHAWVNVSARDATIGYVGYWLLPAVRGRAWPHEL